MAQGPLKGLTVIHEYATPQRGGYKNTLALNGVTSPDVALRVARKHLQKTFPTLLKSDYSLLTITIRPATDSELMFSDNNRSYGVFT